MNSLGAWNKVLLFGLFGAVGCLAGWIVGEPFLAANDYAARQAGAGQGPTLISKPVPTNEPPPPPREFQDRLAAAGAKTGDIQISLIWFNSNDLDLHCVDPSGFEICWRQPQRRSPTGGELDVDRNAGCRLPTAEPVENIYWPTGRAPMGRYRVYLNYYQPCGGGAPNETTYKINVLHGGTRKEFSGTITKADTPDGGPMRLIYEFQTEPKIEVSAPNEFDMGVGTTLKVPIGVRRDFVPGKLDIKAEGLPPGVTAESLTIAAGETKSELVLKADSSVETGKKKFKIVAKGEGAEASADTEVAVKGQFSLWMVLAIGFWTALLAVGLCLALLAGQNKYLGKALFAPGRIPLVAVILGAVAAGFASGTLGQALFYVLIFIGASKVGFVIGWLLLGVLLGWGVSFFIPNLDGKKAALAGLGGGFLGALAFLIMSLAADWIGRLFGAALLGFCIGLMVAVVEVAFRRAWLEVQLGEREVITVNLGPEPVKIGSDSRACTVWARGAAEIALRYWIRDGKVYCEDVPGRREATVGDGDTRAAGNVTVIVRTGNTSAPAGGPPPRPPIAAKPALPPPLPTAVPQVVPRPVPPPSTVPAPAKPSAAPADYDDGMPMPMSPPPPARAGAKSILDIDDMLAGPSRPAPKPTAPAPAPKPAPPAARSVAPPVPVPRPPTSAAQSMAPAAPKPPAPPPPAARSIAPPAPKPPTAGPVTAKASEDACPTCGRKINGKPGTRYCMVCDKTF